MVIRGDKADFSQGSCQPNWAYCTSAGRVQNAAYMNFRECKYTAVESPAEGTSFSEDMIELVITDEMA